MANLRLLHSIIWIGSLFVGITTASAQSLPRTFVSGTGSDANNCSRATPCATFVGALAKTTAGGQISVLDTADYGSVTINKSVAIVNHSGATASILFSATSQPPAGANILIAAGSTDVVTLRGIALKDVPAFQPFGILIQSAQSVVIEDCIIEGTSVGVKVAPTGGDINVVVVNTRLKNNTAGVLADGSSASSVRLQIDKSLITGSTTGSGIIATTSGAPTTVFVTDTVISNNATGVLANGGQGVVVLGKNAITNNGTALSTFNGGSIFSYGTNQINDNGSPGIAPGSINLH